MLCNVALWDRLLRFLIGVSLLAYAVAGGPLWAWGGLFFLVTSAWGVCPLYAALKIKTHKSSSRRRFP